MKIGKDYEIVRDTHSWELREWYDTYSNRYSKTTRTMKKSWHATMEQALMKVLQSEIGTEESDDVEKVLAAIESAKTEIIESIGK